MKIALTIVTFVVISIVIVLSYYGLFADIRLENRNVGPFKLVYEKHIGDYKNTSVIMDKIYYTLLNEDSIATTKGFGLYYDKPGTVETGKQRSIAGCILEGQDEIKVAELSKKYNIKEFPASDSIVVDFPFKGMVSIFIGIFRVYPQISDYLKEKGERLDAPVMEIYDGINKRIIYIVPINLERRVVDSYLIQE
ncbi:GyrI-like domain-containing protein [bacterium]|nr:GyrI-like domain-containing protein [bacterium]